ncbi:MAG TPA: endonuclease III, partial [Dehalococcoidia bacterium]|nr:endonuclease III [Dehalococcoidia bacterium]
MFFFFALGRGPIIPSVTVSEIISLLSQEYGPREWEPEKHLDPLSELIRTLLSQHTSDANSWRAYYRLKARFPTWEDVAEAPVEEIAEAIWLGGLARMKAPRLKALLLRICEERGALALSFLADWPLTEARAWLQGLPGVGPKTAACVLLFSLGRPALPVDTHIHRVAKRLGLIGPRVTAEAAQGLLEAMLKPEEFYPFHMLMIEHGRRLCKAQRPLCALCPLRHGCPTG